MCRIENRTLSKTISIRQSGFGDDAWVILKPLSTTNFSWENPYGQRLIDAKVDSEASVAVSNFNIEVDGSCIVEESLGVQFQVVDVGRIKIVRLTDVSAVIGHTITPTINLGNKSHGKIVNNESPLEIIIELGVVGVSLVDHRPKELCYLYLERLFFSYSSGYDGGTTSRYHLVISFANFYFLEATSFYLLLNILSPHIKMSQVLSQTSILLSIYVSAGYIVLLHGQ